MSLPSSSRALLVLLVGTALTLAGCDALDGGTDNATDAPTTTAPATVGDGGSETTNGGSEVADGPTAAPDPGEVVATTTSPVRPGVEVDVREVTQFDDGLVRVDMDLRNASSEELLARRMVDYVGDVPRLRLVDERAGTVRHWPLADTSRCLCTAPTLSVPAGSTTTIEVWFADVAPDATALRVEPVQFQPVDDVPVRQAPAPAPAAATTTTVFGDDDVEVTLDGVVRGTDGAVATITYGNVGAGAPREFRTLPPPDQLRLVDTAGPTAYRARGTSDTDQRVVSSLPEEVEALAPGDELQFDLLFPSLAPAASAVRLQSGLVSVSGPVTVEDGDAPGGLPSVETSDPEVTDLVAEQARYEAPSAEAGEVERIEASRVGPHVPTAEVSARLTSEAEPGWSMAVRGVARGPGALSTILLDLTATGEASGWPATLGVDGERDLGALAVVDQEGGQRLEVLRSDGDALSTSVRTVGTLDADETVTAWAVAGPISAEATTVSVDVPGFGVFDDVAVLDLAEGDLPASSLFPGRPGLRRDVLAVSRLEGGNGTLVRFRDVNVDQPEPEQVPVGGNACNVDAVWLLDPATGNRYDVLAPCLLTDWRPDVGVGESQVVEMRFPDLPPDVTEVVVGGGVVFPSAPVGLQDGVAPWYLLLPDAADEATGDAFRFGSGPADGAQVVREEEEEVEVTLANDVLFATDSAELSDRATGVINQVAEQLDVDAVPGVVQVVGHTDSQGTDERNAELSLQRATSVQAALDERLARPDLTLEVEGVGASEPVAPNEVDGRDNPDGRARNRRVTITYTVSQ